jgi:hypothetical protein
MPDWIIDPHAAVTTSALMGLREEGVTSATVGPARRTDAHAGW